MREFNRDRSGNKTNDSALYAIHSQVTLGRAGETTAYSGTIQVDAKHGFILLRTGSGIRYLPEASSMQIIKLILEFSAGFNYSIEAHYSL